MQTTETILEQALEIKSKARYISSNTLGTKTLELYLHDKEYFVIWFRRTINFNAVYKVESINLNTAKMLFDNLNW
jgi:hypothetical protein